MRGRQQRLPEVADLREPRGNVVDPEVLDLDAACDLFPRHRRRHRRAGAWPHRIDRRERTAPGVLVVIDEHAARGALRFGVDRGEEPRVPPRDLG